MDEPILIPVRSPRAVSRSVLLFGLATVITTAALSLVLAAAWTAWSIHGSGGPAWDAPRSFWYGLAGLSLLEWVFVRGTLARLRAVRGVGPIIILADHFEVPTKRGADRAQIRYEDVFLFQSGRTGLYIDTHSRLVQLPRWMFESVEDMRALERHILRGIASLSDGDTRLAEMRSRLLVAEVAYRRPARATGRLAFLLLGVYLLEQYMGGASDPVVLVGLGGNAPALVGEGQVFRLLSANFLHAGMGHLHLIFNGVALLSLGSLLERLIGGPRFVLLFILSAVFGAMTSTLVSKASVSVGASAGVFGLLGGLLFLAVKYRRTLPTEFRQPWGWWVLILGINGALPVLVPVIDGAAHAGGMLAGLLVTAALVPQTTPAELLGTPISRGVVLGSAAVLAFTIATSVVGVTSRFEHIDEDVMAVWQAQAKSADPDELNFLAWNAVAIPQAPLRRIGPNMRLPSEEQRIEFGLAAAERAHQLAPERDDLRDTLATAYYRVGQFDRAIELERALEPGAITVDSSQSLMSSLEVLSRAWLLEGGGPMAYRIPPAFRASQLARFELARLVAQGSEAEAPDRSVTPRLSVESGAGAAGLRLIRPPALGPGSELHFVATENDRVVGFAEVVIPSHAPEVMRFDCEAQPCDDWLATYSMRLGYLSVSTTTTATVAGHFSVYDVDPEVAQMPTYVEPTRR